MTRPPTDQTPLGTGTRATTSPGGGRAATAGLIALLVLLWSGTSVLYGVDLWASVIAGRPDADDGGTAALAALPQVIAGVLVLGFAPSLGVLELHRPTGGGADGRSRRMPVRLLVWVGLTALAALVFAVASLLAGVAVIIVLGFLAGAVGTAAASWILVQRGIVAARARSASRAATRAADAGDAITVDLDWTPADIRRKWRIVLLVFVIAAVVSTAGALLMLPGDGDGDGDGAGQIAAVIVQLSFLAPAIACLVVSRTAQFSIASVTTDLTPSDRRLVARRISGRVPELDPELEWRAARLAAFTRIVQPFQLTQSLLIFIGALVPTFLRGDSPLWLTIPMLVLVVAFLATLPWIIGQQRRMRRYADATAELARSWGPDTDVVPDDDTRATAEADPSAPTTA